jgi:hypothetical protein
MSNADHPNNSAKPKPCFEVEYSVHHSFVVEADDEAAAVAYVEMHCECGCLAPEWVSTSTVVVGPAQKLD